MPSPITFTSPLPADDLRFESLSASHALSALESTELTLVSPKPDIAAEKLLGERVNVEVLLREGGKRHFNGYVTRFGIGRHRGRWYQYQATVRPWLWFLTRTSDCRIFQDMTVPEIVEQVFGDHGAIANFEFKLTGSYRKRVYCVQYRETDYNFVARLLEEEGIYWFFEHTDSAHKLVLVDDVGSLATAEGCEKLPYFSNAGQAPPDVDYVGAWTCSREVRTGKAVLTSYDFERPSTKLLVEQTLARSHALDDYEQFDFDGEYTQKPDGQHLVDMRLEEQQARFQRSVGGTNARALAVGHLFKLERHPRADQNDEYLCAQASYTARLAAYEAGGQQAAAGAADDEFQCNFSALPSSQAFRPERRTPKPFVQGPQTAVVVGPSGEEIFTDKYGRVKVQFHWDRYGKKNEKSSCWVRVSSPWAGKSFGFIQIPRIGQEVVVDFLEGDPDQPLITGRVYNAEQMPPWELPANATQSGVLTRSSKGGAYGNANAIRFEDKKGSEQLWIHAEKNMDIEVENDETHWVGHDRTKTIDHDETVMVKHDRTETVGHDEVITIGNDRTETIVGNLTIAVDRTKSEAVALNSAETVGIAKELSVGGLYQVSVGAAHNTTVGAAHALEVGGSSTEAIGGSKTLSVAGGHSLTIGGAQTTTVGKDFTLNIDGKSAQTVKGEHAFKAKKIAITAEDELTITVGSAKLVMKKDGSILLDGKDISTKASGKVNIKASSDIVLKGSAIKEN